MTPLASPSKPGPTEPGPTEPGPTEPGPTEPGPTEPDTRSPHALATRPTPTLAALSPYRPPARTGRAPDALSLDWNEADAPPPPAALQALAHALADPRALTRYPVEAVADLEARLGRDHPGIGVRVTPGSDAALRRIFEVFLAPGDRVLAPQPTYGHAAVFLAARGAEVHDAPRPDPFRPDPVALDAALHRLRPRLFYLPNPGNPTGCFYSPHDLVNLARRHPATLFVIDEAYGEFVPAPAPGGAPPSVLPAALDHPNLIVTRTFSKAWALAALRVGYLAAGPAALRALDRLHDPKAPNLAGVLAARAALDQPTWLATRTATIAAHRARLVAHLADLGVDAPDQPVNFVPLRPEDPRRFHAACARQGLHVRLLGGLVRITVPADDPTPTLERLSAAIGQKVEPTPAHPAPAILPAERDPPWASPPRSHAPSVTTCTPRRTPTSRTWPAPASSCFCRIAWAPSPAMPWR